MADILNNNQNPLNTTSNNTSLNNNAVPMPATPLATPISPVNPSTDVPIVIPPVDPNAPVNTGEQYEVNELHPDDLDVQWTRWKCLVCNYIYEGSKPLKKCPRCGNEDPDKFEDID